MKKQINERKVLMKRHKIWLALLLSLAVGCGNGQNADGEQQAENLTQTEMQKQEEMLEKEDMAGQENMPEQSETEHQAYTSSYLKNIDDIALTTDGRLYAVGLQNLNTTSEEKDGKEWLVIEQPSQWLYEFDSDGKMVCVGEMMFSSGEVMALEWYDDILYMVVPRIDKMPVLYQVGNLAEVHSDVVQTVKKLRETDPNVNNYIKEYLAFSNLDMWNLQELYRFDAFSEINRFVFMGERLYVFGILANPDENPFGQNLEAVENYPNRYEGQAVGYMDIQNLEAGITLLPMPGIPQDMIKLTEDTLGIYLAGEEETCFWKYIPAKEKWEKTDIAEVKYSEMTEESVSYGKFVAYEDGCFYVKGGNFICYKTGNGMEQELFESGGLVHCLKTDGTFLYYYSHEWSAKEVRRVRISELLKIRKK